VNYIVSANTDVGSSKLTNQDSLSVRLLNTPSGSMVFAVICDGMGGLSSGELASATVVKAFLDWTESSLPMLAANPIEDHIIKSQWENIITSQNEKIMNYGKQQGLKDGIGTTAVVILLTDSRYYILNVGDSRAYEIADNLQQITEDQTLVAREVRNGNMTPEEAAVDPQRNVLLQCVGASDVVYPEMFFGQTKQNVVYMLCSDGFRHEITPDEIWSNTNPSVLTSKEIMDYNAKYLIDLLKQRQEKDNISVIFIRTY
jgi:serine/threonine protein phosphatase PrpC